MKEKKTMKPVGLILGLLLVGAGIFLWGSVHFVPSKFGVVEEDFLVQVPVEALPGDTLYITEGRRLYQRGAMTLVIPAIEVFTPVGESTEPEGLREMPGLYEFSQLPEQGDVNVSIAGHRDIHDLVFYSLDRLEAGDYLYLLFDGAVYQYEFRGSKVIRPDDWSVILPQGFSCLTLTTCDPIGTTLNRLVVTAELVDIGELTGEYRFATDNKASP